MSLINTDNSNQGNNPLVKKQQDDSPVLFSKTQFTNSIMSRLDKMNVTGSQKAQIGQQAASIFDQYDSNKDQNWTQAEANNGGAVALSNFYEMVNNAMKGIKSQDNVDAAGIVGNIGQVAGTNTEAPQYSQEQVTQMTQDLTTDFKNLFKDAEFVSIDTEGKKLTVKIKDENGNEQTQEISLENVPPEVLANFNPEKCLEIERDAMQELKQEAVDNYINMGTGAGFSYQGLNNITQLGITVEQNDDGTFTLKSEDGQVMGTISKDDQGNNVYDKQAIDVNKVATIKSYEAQGYQFSGWANADKTEIKMTKDGEEITVKLDPNTGQEIQ